MVGIFFFHNNLVNNSFFFYRTPSLREREREAAAESAGTALATGQLQQLNNQVSQRPMTKTTQYRKINHWPILLKLCSLFQFFKDSSNRKPATACNPYMIGHVANEVRYHKFREDCMRLAKVGILCVVSDE